MLKSTNNLISDVSSDAPSSLCLWYGAFPLPHQVSHQLAVFFSLLRYYLIWRASPLCSFTFVVFHFWLQGMGVYRGSFFFGPFCGHTHGCFGPRRFFYLSIFLNSIYLSFFFLCWVFFFLINTLFKDLMIAALPLPLPTRSHLVGFMMTSVPPCHDVCSLLANLVPTASASCPSIQISNFRAFCF